MFRGSHSGSVKSKQIKLEPLRFERTRSSLRLELTAGFAASPSHAGMHRPTDQQRNKKSFQIGSTVGGRRKKKKKSFLGACGGKINVKYTLRMATNLEFRKRKK